MIRRRIQHKEFIAAPYFEFGDNITYTPEELQRISKWVDEYRHALNIPLNQVWSKNGTYGD